MADSYLAHVPANGDDDQGTGSGSERRRPYDPTRFEHVAKSQFPAGRTSHRAWLQTLENYRRRCQCPDPLQLVGSDRPVSGPTSARSVSRNQLLDIGPIGVQQDSGEAALGQLSKVEKTFLQTMPGVSDYSSKSELIDLLMLAIEDHKIAWVAYQSERATEPVSLEMYPYGIVYHKGSLYLVAHSRSHEIRQDAPESSPTGTPAVPTKQRASDTPILNPSRDAHEPAVPGDAHEPAAPVPVRHFKIDRVTGVDVQTLQFSPDPDFSLEKHFANSFGIFQSDDPSSKPKKIRIRFNSEVARYVQEKTWHPSQKITKEKDGSVVLEVSLNDTHEIKAWTLSFGPKATVLEPKSLRDEIVSDVEQLLKTYQASNRRVS